MKEINVNYVCTQLGLRYTPANSMDLMMAGQTIYCMECNSTECVEPKTVMRTGHKFIHGARYAVGFHISDTGSHVKEVTQHG